MVRRAPSYRHPKEANHFSLFHTGGLPLTIGQLKANGCSVDLSSNNGFTLSSDISAVMDATKLDYSGCYLSGAARPIIPPPHGSQSRIRVSCTGPIPVELLRWKFVEGRTVELKKNAGLELPSNIGELGDSVTKIDLSGHGLRGVARPIIPPPHGSQSRIRLSCTGPLPKVLPPSLE